MTYSYDPYTGTLVTTDPESGVVITYVGGKQVSSKTASQVALESQIKSAGATVTKEAEQQIIMGLQEQIKTALKGEEPGTFDVTTPEGTFKATSGITPEHLRGATGSVLGAGYKTVNGREVPVDRTFTTSSGKSFTASAKKQIGNEWIWQTPYGEVRATPGRLQTEIERLLTVQQLTAKGKEIMQKRVRVMKESRTLPARLEFLLEHPFEPTEYMIGSTILHGSPFAFEGLKKYEREREVWMEEILATKDRTGLAVSGMIEPVGLVLGAKFLPGITKGLGKSAIGTGIGIGVGTGLATIKSIETWRGLETGDELKVGSGVLGILLGAGITKAVWEAGVVPELEPFAPKRRLKTYSYTEAEIKSKEFIEDQLTAKGIGKGKIITPMEDMKIETEADFIFKSTVPEEDITFTTEVGGVRKKIIEDSFFGAKKVTEFAPEKFIGIDVTIPAEELGVDFFISGSGTQIEGKEMVEGARLSKKIFQFEDVTGFLGKGVTDKTIDTGIGIVRDPFIGDVGVGGGRTDLITEFKPTILKPSSLLRAEHERFITSIDKSAESVISPILPSAKTKAKSEIDIKLDTIGITEIEAKTDQKLKMQMIPSISLTGDLDIGGREKEDLRNILVNLQGLGSFEDVAQDQDQLLKLDQATISVPGLVPTATPFIEETGTGIPGILWPDWKLKDDTFLATPSKKVKRGYAYTPSLLAIEWGITGKMPGIITGFGVRPLPIGKRRKGKNPFELVFP